MPCSICQKTDGVSPCATCGRAICPSHRIGNGSASDSYVCGLACGVDEYVDELQSGVVRVRGKLHGREMWPGFWYSRDVMIGSVISVVVVVTLLMLATLLGN